MPDREFHEMIDLIFLGKKMTKVHRFKDYPSKYLGPRHRKLFHDPLTNIMLGIVYGPEAFISACLHDMFDFASSKAKRRRKRR